MNQESTQGMLMARANEGDPKSQFELGEYFRLKNGVGSIAVAAAWLLKAANQNYAPAQLALALLYLDDLVPEDYSRDARYWLQTAAQNGCKESSTLLQELTVPDEDSDYCVLLVEAEEGNPQAQFELGCAYYYGLSHAQDVTAGLRWLLKAALGGHSKAQFQMGTHYLYGQYCATDSGEAIKWLSLSAKQNHHFALYCLGYCHYEGIGVSRNDDQSAAYLLRAAQQGNSEAEFQLARFYYDGVVFPQNHEQAESWLQAAALHGHEGAKQFMEHGFS